MDTIQTDAQPILLFDGTCNFCNRWVQFVLAHEADSQIQFAPLQSEIGQQILRHHKLPTEDFDTLVFVEGGRSYVKSTGALKLTAYLKPPWRSARFLLLVPRLIRDLAYGVIATHRYRLFGKQDACMVPDPSVRGRFL